MEKDLCRGLYTSLFCVIIPTLFPYFLRFWYPYILLHFKCFLLLYMYHSNKSNMFSHKSGNASCSHPIQHTQHTHIHTHMHTHTCTRTHTLHAQHWIRLEIQLIEQLAHRQQLHALPGGRAYGGHHWDLEGGNKRGVCVLQTLLVYHLCTNTSFSLVSAITGLECGVEWWIGLYGLRNFEACDMRIIGRCMNAGQQKAELAINR